jgi:hypothetical protein
MRKENETHNSWVGHVLNNLQVSYYNDYIKYILKKYKFKDYRLFKYYK